MDARVYILAGTFALFVVAVVMLIASVARARREPLPAPADLQVWDESAIGAAQPIDTSLAGLHIDVNADAPSAALLTPLRTGEWMPPDSPAPTQDLNAAALSQRIAGYVPLPDVPEPAFSIEQQPTWVAGAPNGTLPEHMRPEPDWARRVPEVDVAPQPEAAAPSSHVIQPAVATGDGFDQEIAALLPTMEFGAVMSPAAGPVDVYPSTGEPTPVAPQPVAPQPVAPQPVAPIPVAPQPVATAPIAYVPEPEPPSEPEFESPQVFIPQAPVAESAPIEDLPVPVLPVEPEPSSEPEVVWSAPIVDHAPQPVMTAVEDHVPPLAAEIAPAVPLPVQVAVEPVLPTPAAVFEPVPPMPPVEPVAPVLPVAPAAVQPVGQAEFVTAETSPEAAAGEESWQAAMREQQPAAPPATARVERPEVRISTAEAPAPVLPVEPQTPPVPMRSPRPRARVNVPGSQVPVVAPSGPPADQSAEDPGSETSDRAAVADIVMAAPVEMWFGDARVGVKAGTATYDRFKKYADVLFADLRASGRVAR